MNRRGFLSALAAAVAGPMVIDPERILWRPGAKLISIPANFRTTFDLDDPNLYLALDEFHRRYIAPAVEVWAKEAARSMDDFYRRYFQEDRTHELAQRIL